MVANKIFIDLMKINTSNQLCIFWCCLIFATLFWSNEECTTTPVKARNLRKWTKTIFATNSISEGPSVSIHPNLLDPVAPNWKCLAWHLLPRLQLFRWLDLRTILAFGAYLTLPVDFWLRHVPVHFDLFFFTSLIFFSLKQNMYFWLRQALSI